MATFHASFADMESRMPCDKLIWWWLESRQMLYISIFYWLLVVKQQANIRLRCNQQWASVSCVLPMTCSIQSQVLYVISLLILSSHLLNGDQKTRSFTQINKTHLVTQIVQPLNSKGKFFLFFTCLGMALYFCNTYRSPFLLHKENALVIHNYLICISIKSHNYIKQKNMR